MSDNGQLEKAVTMEQLAQTVTDPIHRQNYEVGGGISVLSWLVQVADYLLPPWWSKRRDAALRNLAFQSDFFQGAAYKVSAKLTDVPFQVRPRDPSIKSHRRQAEDYVSTLVEGSELGAGWGVWLPKFLLSLWTQDNGAFSEILGDGDPEGPIKGPALGLKVLDPSRCIRTSNPIYPVIYTTTQGKRIKFHYTRIIFTSQMPDPAEEMYNVGHCWLSRCSNAIQNLVDIGIFKQEKLGSRPQRRMVIGKGVEAYEIWDAFRRAEMQMDAQGLRRYAKNVVLGGLTKDDSIETIDLTDASTLSDEQVMTEIGVFLLAMTGGFPPRWIWPATTTGATKADAESQHLAGISSGGQILQDIAYMLGGSERGLNHIAGKFLPPHLMMTFDYQDDQQDRDSADTKNVRSQVWDRNIKAGLINERVAREQMLDAGDITESQFEDLELESGRLADGSSIEGIFYTADPVYKSIFGDIDPIEPNLDEVAASLRVARYVAANPDNVAQKRVADTAAKALEWLLNRAKGEMLQQAATQALQQKQPGGNPPQPAEGEENNPPPTEPESKTKERSTYKFALMRNLQLLWEGKNSAWQFKGAMEQAIRNQFPEAWSSGAKMCGIRSDELTDEEDAELNSQIQVNIDSLGNLADYTVAHNRASGDSFTLIQSQAEVWLNSYDRVSEIAKSYACSNQKMIWILGSTEEHCKDCRKFAGRVYRMSTWNKIGIQPKSLSLECGGFRCDCKWVPTSKAISRGRLPSFS